MREHFYVLCILSAAIASYYIFERRKLKRSNSSLFQQQDDGKKSETEVDRISLKNIKWHYRGEGNEYLGISLPETQQILRIKKFPYPVGITECLLDWIYWNSKSVNQTEIEAKKIEEGNLSYYKLLAIFIGKYYVQPAQYVLLDSKDIKKIHKITEPLRPENRKIKRITFGCGSLLVDYAHLPVSWNLASDQSSFAVEIKPKQGWIAQSERIYPICTYCLNQYIKLENKEITKISDYCPMDLFSGNVVRMRNAIRCLSYSPQNNLKLFKDGKLIYDENSSKQTECDVFTSMFDTLENQFFDSYVNEFCDLITKALVADMLDSKQCTNTEHQQHPTMKKPHWVPFKFPSRKTCNFRRNGLPQGCVLDRILKIQELDQWGSLEIADKFQQNKNNFESLSTNVEQISNCAKCFFGDKSENADDNNIEINSFINQYLMASVAKDCSLMITFKKIASTSDAVPAQNIIKSDSGVRYAFQVAVFDISRKYPSSILKHVKKRRILAEMYTKYF